MKTSETLRRAADHMEQVGLNQDGHYYQGGAENADVPDRLRPCCTVGAVQMVNDSHLDTREALVELARDMGFGGRYAHDQIVKWSDNPATTQEQVLARLRATADRLETEEAEKERQYGLVLGPKTGAAA